MPNGACGSLLINSATSAREPLGNEPQKSTQGRNLYRLNNYRESEAGLTLFHRFRC